MTAPRTAACRFCYAPITRELGRVGRWVRDADGSVECREWSNGAWLADRHAPA